LAFALALDAISNPGPADFQRAGGSSLCSLLPIDLSELLRPPLVSGLLQIIAADLRSGLPDPHLAPNEPPLMPYARDEIE
ncbi:lipase, partial [Salinisphaera sp. W335]|nr:lipase [Salinisphaera sp. W335]